MIGCDGPATCVRFTLSFGNSGQVGIAGRKYGRKQSFFSRSTIRILKDTRSMPLRCPTARGLVRDETTLVIINKGDPANPMDLYGPWATGQEKPLLAAVYQANRWLQVPKRMTMPCQTLDRVLGITPNQVWLNGVAGGWFVLTGNACW